MLRIMAVSAALLAVGTLPAFAQNRSIDQRQYWQEHRIERGIARGEITPREAARLRQENWEIERMQRRAQADGFVSPRERDRIDAAQDRLGRHIRRESHDHQRRYGYGGYGHGGYGNSGYGGYGHGWYR